MLVEALSRWCAADLAALALVSLRPPERDAPGTRARSVQRWSREALLRQVRTCIQGFRDQGLQPGDRAYVYLPHSPEWVVVVVSLLALEVVYVPIAHRQAWERPSLPPVATSWLVEGLTESPSSQGPVRVAGLPFLAGRVTLTRRCPSANAAGAGPPFPVAYILHTSGTVSGGAGVPVQVEGRTFLTNLQSIHDRLGVQEGQRFLLVSPTTFDPSLVELGLPLLGGGVLVVVDRLGSPHAGPLSPSELFDAIMGHRVTHLMMTPSRFSLFAPEQRKALFSPSSPSAVTDIVLGGEPFPAALFLQSRRPGTRPIRLWNIYGTTECSVWASLFQIPLDWSHPGRIPIGEPLAETTIFVEPLPLSRVGSTGQQADESGTAMHRDAENAEEGVLGTIFLGGVGRRYLVGQEARPLPIRDTGDLGVERAGHIYVMGRRDDQVKRLGNRVSLGQVAQVITAALPAVAQCIVLQDPGPGVLVAFVVLREHAKVMDGSAVPAAPEDSAHLSRIVRDACLPWLPEYSLPDACLALPALPLTSNGKVDRRALVRAFHKTAAPAPASDDAPSAHSLSDPADAAAIKALIMQHLGLCEGPLPEDGDTFLALGGTSMSAVLFIYHLLRGHALADHGDAPSPSVHADLLGALMQRDLGTFCAAVLACLSRLDRAADPSTDVELVQTTGSFENHDAELRLPVPIPPPPALMPVAPVLPAAEAMRRRTRVLAQRGGRSTLLPESFFPDAHSGTVRVRWRVNLGRCIDASPLIVARNPVPSAAAVTTSPAVVYCYIGSHSGTFACIRDADGHVQWSRSLGRIEASACWDAAREWVWIGSYDGCCYGLCAWTGALRAKVSLQGEIKAAAILDVECGRLWVGNYSQHVYCLELPGHAPELEHGEQDPDPEQAEQPQEVVRVLLRAPVDGSVFAAVRLHPRLALAATLAGSIYAWDRESLTRMWRTKLPCPLFATPALYGDEWVLAGGVDGRLYALQMSEGGAPTSCVLRWHLDLGGPIFTSPVVEEETGMVAVGCHGGTFVRVPVIAGPPSRTDAAGSLTRGHVGAMFASPFLLRPGCWVVGLMERGCLALLEERQDEAASPWAQTPLDVPELPPDVDDVYASRPPLLFSSPVQWGPYVWVGGRDDHCVCLQVGDGG